MARRNKTKNAGRQAGGGGRTFSGVCVRVCVLGRCVAVCVNILSLSCACVSLRLFAVCVGVCVALDMTSEKQGLDPVVKVQK